MSIDEIILQLIYLPRELGKEKEKSFFSLLKISGYFENHAQISEVVIRNILARYPECVNDWMQLSEDKRADGWYFSGNNDGSYTIGLRQSRVGEIKKTQYNNPLDACAAFIKHEIEDIRVG